MTSKEKLTTFILILLLVMLFHIIVDSVNAEEADMNGLYFGAGPQYSIGLNSNSVRRNFVTGELLKEWPLAKTFSYDAALLYGHSTNIEADGMSYLSGIVGLNWYFIDTKRFDVGAGFGGGLVQYLNADTHQADVTGDTNFALRPKLIAKTKLGNKRNSRNLLFVIDWTHFSSCGTSRLWSEEKLPNSGIDLAGFKFSLELW